ncbi:MAG: acyltransferase [Lentimicrobiaceae bacterium]|nr:acyltransferase [Lentimicrobiaceae bacterium]
MNLREQIFSIQNQEDFTAVALQVFDYQYENCKIYRQYADMLHCEKERIVAVEQIPFLPIEFFKTQRIIAEGKSAQLRFTSSGTTGMQTATHFVADKTLYEESFLRCFRRFVGNPKDYAVLALLPSYLERENSSLVYMVNELIVQSENPDSGFYLYDFEQLADKINRLDANNKKILVFGVSFALLDLVGQYQFNPKNLIVFETGGMKNRRKEITREELHQKLQIGFGVKTIYSEYGMTELLSQAYSTDGKTFNAPAWVKILIRDPQDPLSIVNQPDRRGGINVIDLANLYSCSFIATQDLGKIHSDGSFEVLGRIQNSDIRGCNMLID